MFSFTVRSTLIRLFALLMLLVSLLPTHTARAAGYVVDTTDDNTTDDTSCTLREAILAANNDSSYNDDCGTASTGDDTITFNISGPGPHTITLSSTLPAIVSASTAGTLTINGGGNITISGTTNVRVMYVNSGADLTLQNLTIANGHFGFGSAGGVYNDGGTVTITNSTFSNNVARDYGGGVYNNGGTVIVTNSTFSNNNASIGRGGGIANNGTLIITDSTFSDNRAGYDGGGVYNNGGTLTVTDSTFSGNRVTSGAGGGVYNNAGTVTIPITITNSIFSDNSAIYGGGVFNANTGTLTITDSTFSNNSATYAGGVDNDGTLTVTNSTFLNNSASNSSGGVHNDGTLTVTNSTFSDNSADYGGGVTNYGTLTIIDSTFSNNSASNDDGGGVDNNAGMVTITNSTFSGNSAYRGGGVSNNSTLTVTNSTFADNNANYRGGGMYNFAGTLTVTNSTFSGNNADDSGGGVFVFSGTATLRNTIIANSTSGGDCVTDVALSNSKNNLIESTGTNACGLTNGVNGNKIGVDPNLGALTGSPAYFPLNPGSPAIDAGDNTTCAAAPVNNQSQNGLSRPQDGNGDFIFTCDIGAYERLSQATFRSSGPQDGWVLESSETSNWGGSQNAIGMILFVGDDAQDRQYRAILSFNTAPLPGNAVIVKVTLQLKLQGVVGTDPFNTHGNLLVDVRKGAFSNNADLQQSDFQSPASTLAVGAISKMPIGGWHRKVWTSGIFPYINKAGLTQFRLRFAKDDNDDLGADYLKFYSGNVGIANRPQLIIEYYVP